MEFKAKQYKLAIVGCENQPSKYGAYLEHLAKQDENVVLTGLLTGKSLQEIYSHARLFVLPSYNEGLSVALLEAISYGLFCIASDIQANREVDLLNENRFFRPGDIDDLTKKLKEFVDKSFTEEEIAIQRAKIAQKYDWGTSVDRTLQLFKRVFGTGRKGATS